MLEWQLKSKEIEFIPTKGLRKSMIISTLKDVLSVRALGTSPVAVKLQNLYVEHVLEIMNLKDVKITIKPIKLLLLFAVLIARKLDLQRNIQLFLKNAHCT